MARNHAMLCHGLAVPNPHDGKRSPACAQGPGAARVLASHPTPGMRGLMDVHRSAGAVPGHAAAAAGAATAADTAGAAGAGAATAAARRSGGSTSKQLAAAAAAAAGRFSLVAVQPGTGGCVFGAGPAAGGGLAGRGDVFKGHEIRGVFVCA